MLHHGGSFTELFGDLKSNIVSVPDDSNGFVDIDLRMDNFLRTGIDPFFDAARDVFFVLYTNDNREGQQFSIENIVNTTYNESNPVRVTIHGLNNNYTLPASQTVKNAYLEEGNYNVVSCRNIYFDFFFQFLSSRLSLTGQKGHKIHYTCIRDFESIRWLLKSRV